MDKNHIARKIENEYWNDNFVREQKVFDPQKNQWILNANYFQTFREIHILKYGN